MNPNITEIKQCITCLNQLDLIMFSMDFRNNYYKNCNTCKDKFRDYRQNDNIKEYTKKYYIQNKKKIDETSSKWTKDNKDRVNEPIICEKCGSMTTRNHRWRHHQTTKCKDLNNKKIT